jgi:hypothetical protein
MVTYISSSFCLVPRALVSTSLNLPSFAFSYAFLLFFFSLPRLVSYNFQSSSQEFRILLKCFPEKKVWVHHVSRSAVCMVKRVDNSELSPWVVCMHFTSLPLFALSGIKLIREVGNFAFAGKMIPVFWILLYAMVRVSTVRVK